MALSMIKEGVVSVDIKSVGVKSVGAGDIVSSSVSFSVIDKVFGDKLKMIDEVRDDLLNIPQL